MLCIMLKKSLKPVVTRELYSSEKVVEKTLKCGLSEIMFISTFSKLSTLSVMAKAVVKNKI